MSSWSRTVPDVLARFAPLAVASVAVAAERRTGDVLKELEAEGWQVRHGETRPRWADVGFLVSRPTGVFLLETKSLPGRISVQDGVLTAHSRDDDETVWAYRGLRGSSLPPPTRSRRGPT